MKSLFKQTLRAALSGCVIGAAFGLLASGSVWFASAIFSERPSPRIACVEEALTPLLAPLALASLPGVAAAYPDCDAVALGAKAAVWNALFWATVVAFLLSWPGPVFAILTALIALWDSARVASEDLRRRFRAT